MVGKLYPIIDQSFIELLQLFIGEVRLPFLGVEEIVHQEFIIDSTLNFTEGGYRQFERLCLHLLILQGLAAGLTGIAWWKWSVIVLWRVASNRWKRVFKAGNNIQKYGWWQFMELQGEQIPKATMTSYLKEKLGKTKISNDFTEGILHLAKQYVTKVANKANEICTNEKKKTISLEHLYKSIEFFKLGSQMEELKKVEQEVKNDVQMKQQMKIKIQKSYEEMIKDKQDNQVPKTDVGVVPLKQSFSENLLDKSDEEEDYEEDQEEEAVE